MEAGDPSEGMLDHPAMTTEFLARLDATPSDARFDPALTACTATIIGFVGVQLVRTPAWPAALSGSRRHGIEQRFQGHAIVDTGRRQRERERHASAIGDEVAPGPWLPAVGRVRSRGCPSFAAMDALSTQAWPQPTRPAFRNRCSDSRCRRSYTLAACQLRNRRQQVTPELHPVSSGSISHGMPVRSANRMPVSAARFGTGALPLFGFAGAAGSGGSMICRSPSETKGDAIPPHE